MAPVVIDISSTEETRDVVHGAVQALVEGKLVAFPTETVYGLAASALDENAVRALVEVKNRKSGHPLPLAIKSADDALDYVPDLNPLARRLARRCWPGPVTLVVNSQHPESLLGHLAPSVRRAVTPGDTVGLRVPAHPLILDVLRMLTGPLVLSSANRSGGQESITAAQVAESIGDDVCMILDDGQSRYGQPSSVVRVGDGKVEMLREGVVAEKTIHRLSSLVILLVCTGNTCRSPMAEMLCKKQIAQRLGCEPAQVEQRGVVVMSAGVGAVMGGRASGEAIDVMRGKGLDLSSHESQPLTPHLVHLADVIYTMTRSHRGALLAQWPEAAAKTFSLCRDEQDVADPIGRPRELYESCADQIDAALWSRIDQLDLPSPEEG